MNKEREKPKTRVVTEQQTLSSKFDAAVSIDGKIVGSAEIPAEVNVSCVVSFLGRVAANAYQLGYEQGKLHVREDLMAAAVEFVKNAGWTITPETKQS